MFKNTDEFKQIIDDSYFELTKKHYDTLEIKQTNKILEKTKIAIHEAVHAISLACSNYKSAITNFKNGHIKHFRIRYWKLNKPIKIMTFEKSNFKSNSIRKSILGNVKSDYNGKQYDFSSIECDSIL